MKLDEMGRSVDMGREPGSLDDGPAIGHHRALAVGAGDMDDRRHPALRTAEPLEQAPHALELEIDDFRVQLEEAGENSVAHLHSRFPTRLTRQPPRSPPARAAPPPPRPAARAGRAASS